MFKLSYKLLRIKEKANRTVEIFNNTIKNLTTANDELKYIAIESMKKAEYYDDITADSKEEIEKNNLLIEGIKDLLKK